MRFHISAHEELLSRDDLEMYAQTVAFIGYWLEKHNGAQGKNSQELFEEFRDNVVVSMKELALRGEIDDVSSRNFGLRPGES